MKRLIDVLLSSLAFVVLLPVMVIIAIVIKFDSRGAVLYRGQRVGADGKVFRMLKFRTMVVDAEQVGGPSTADDDPRITRVGRVLRKCKLDELPQLINVL